jgi:hypothetical protein
LILLKKLMQPLLRKLYYVIQKRSYLWFVFRNGTVVSCEAHGSVQANSKLSGMPDLSLNFVNAKVIDDVSFHPCVRYVLNICIKRLFLFIRCSDIASGIVRKCYPLYLQMDNLNWCHIGKNILWWKSKSVRVLTGP